jgi:cyclopropane fatty-acyl-phospholipid synthase-like methyltransferase
VAGASERLKWAIDALDPRPDDRILEIGCGHGVAVHLICARLTDGEITALDRSEKMIAIARKQNADAIAAGRARIERAEFPDVDLGEGRFDKVFAVHVAPLWRKAPAMLPAVRRLLAPDGTLHLLGHTPPQMADAEAMRRQGEDISAALSSHGFSSQVRVEETPGGTGLSVTATPV